VDALERWQLSRVYVLLRFVAAIVRLQPPKCALSLPLDVAVVEIDCASEGASAVTCQRAE
jgi:hypothetical protein